MPPDEPTRPPPGSGDQPSARTPRETAHDRGVRILREALADGRAALHRPGKIVVAVFGGSLHVPLSGTNDRGYREARRHLRDLHESATGTQPSAEVLRAMADALRSAADR